MDLGGDIWTKEKINVHDTIIHRGAFDFFVERKCDKRKLCASVMNKIHLVVGS